LRKRRKGFNTEDTEEAEGAEYKEPASRRRYQGSASKGADYRE
jgi:hypothetical protein